MLHITERMVTLAKLGGKHRFSADIGTDHGYLAMHLVKAGLAEHVYAIDNKEGPASKARKNSAEENLSQYISGSVADGFSGLVNVQASELPGAVFIAGIGGMVTADIVARGMDIVSKIDRLILQPANREDATREFLYDQGFNILDENLGIIDKLSKFLNETSYYDDFSKDKLIIQQNRINVYIAPYKIRCLESWNPYEMPNLAESLKSH